MRGIECERLDASSERFRQLCRLWYPREAHVHGALTPGRTCRRSAAGENRSAAESEKGMLSTQQWPPLSPAPAMCCVPAAPQSRPCSVTVVGHGLYISSCSITASIWLMRKTGPTQGAPGHLPPAPHTPHAALPRPGTPLPPTLPLPGGLFWKQEEVRVCLVVVSFTWAPKNGSPAQAEEGAGQGVA